MRSLWTNLWQSLGYAKDLPRYTLVKSGINHPYMNGVMQLKTESFTTEEIALLDRSFQDKKLSYLWILHEADYRDVEPTLIRLGHKIFSHLDGMELTLTFPPQFPKNFTVNPVKTDHEFASWLSVMQEAFDVPNEIKAELTSLYYPTVQSEHFLHAVIYDGAEVVASGTAHFTRQATPPTCELFYIATKKDKRNRGFASAIVSFLIHEAYKRGLRTFHLAATPKGKGVYERFGFKKVCSFKLYTSPDGLQ